MHVGEVLILAEIVARDRQRSATQGRKRAGLRESLPADRREAGHRRLARSQPEVAEALDNLIRCRVAMCQGGLGRTPAASLGIEIPAVIAASETTVWTNSAL